MEAAAVLRISPDELFIELWALTLTYCIVLYYIVLYCIILYYIVLYCIVLYLSISMALLTAWAFQKRSRPQQLTLCRSLHTEALQATASEGLAQGPYVAARAIFESANPAVERHRLYQCDTTPQLSNYLLKSTGTTTMIMAFPSNYM